MSEILDCDEILEIVAPKEPEPVLQDDGLHCPDGTILPRASHFDNEFSYKYSIKEFEYRSHLVKLCMEKFPNVDAHMVEIMVDQHLQHPETLVEKMEKDEVYMKKFKK